MTPPLHPPRPRSEAELLLSVQLEQAGIPFVRELIFAPPRKWAADFAIAPTETSPLAFLVEVEGGSYTGDHKRGKAYESDCDKNNEAMRLGWRVYRFTPAHVNDGRALAVIKAALGIEQGGTERVA